MQITVFQLVVFTHHKVAEEPFKVFGGAFHSCGQVLIVCTHQRIAEIPRMLFEGVVVYTIAKLTQILDGKYRRCAGVALGKRVNLPYTRHKIGDTSNHSWQVNAFIAKQPFLLEIIIQRSRNHVARAIKHRCSIKNPLFFLDIVLSVTSCAKQYTLKQTPMNCSKHCWREGERILGKQTSYARRNPVGLVSASLLASALLGLVVGGYATVHLIDADAFLDMVLCRLQKVARGFQSVDCLKPDGHLPVFSTLFATGFSLGYVFLEVHCVLFLLQCKDTTFF